VEKLAATATMARPAISPVLPMQLRLEFRVYAAPEPPEGGTPNLKPDATGFASGLDKIYLRPA